MDRVHHRHRLPPTPPRVRAPAASAEHETAVPSPVVLSALLGVARELTQTFDRARILTTIVHSVNALARTDTATMALLDDDGSMRPFAWDGLSDELAATLAPLPRESPVLQALLGGSTWSAADGSGPPPLLRDLVAWRTFGAVAVVPLTHDDRPLGVLTASRIDPRAWSEQDLVVLGLIASQAAIAIHNADVIAEADRWAAQLSAVQASISRLNRLNTVEAIGQAIVDETKRVIDYHNCRVYLLEPPDVLTPVAFRGDVGAYTDIPLELLRTRVGHGFVGWVAQHNEPILVDDADADPRGLTIPGTASVEESLVLVPMRFDERVIGVVALAKLGLRQFDERDLQLITVLADAAGTAIESARAFEEVRRREREMQSLLALSAEVAQTLDPMRAADMVADHVARAFDATAVAILLSRPEAGVIETLGSHPHREAGIRESRDLEGHPLIRRVMVEQRPAVVQAGDSLGDAAEIMRLREVRLATSLFVPLVAKGAGIGVLRLRWDAPRTVDDEALGFAQAMANEAAMALENARLFEATRDLADHDPLSNFYNHRYLQERLGEELLRARRTRGSMGLLMIDLDDFKLVNDTLGHQMGDQVLRWAADLIRSTLRETDIPARYGGDEFAVILPDADGDAARVAAGRIATALGEAAFRPSDRASVPIGASIGVASFPEDARTASELIAAADQDLYRAKREADRPAAGGDAEADANTAA